MSAEKTTNPCNKFQANIFNKSKCQNCFKSREVHLLSDDGLEQAKPVYGGWLCLAPEGTDFDNPAQRSRKWQRRFFILYENGHLSFALDELPSTLPQGTVDVRLCTWVGNAEPRTGQRNALCLTTPQQELFIRAESREMINGWCEQIAAFPHNNKPSGSRKHKVDHDPSQEASPAKMAATGLCRQEVEPAGGRAGEPGAGLRKDAQLGGGLSGTAMDMEARGPDQPSSGSRLQCHPATSRGRSSSAGTEIQPSARGKGPADHSHNHRRPAAREDSGPSQTVMALEPGYPTATETKQGDQGDQSESRMGRNGARANKREMLSCGDTSVPERRAKSLDRRTSESIMTPDLLNFKKGWMVKLEEEDQWRKYWFVLSADSLRYYKDSLAEEALDLHGEIDLTKCYDVSEYQVLRNYGFQIHTQRGVFTLSAMTAGIRKNWIHALMKNVTRAKAPDVASLPGLHIPTEALPKPDVTRDSQSEERQRDESCKTSDQTKFKPLRESPSELEIRMSGEPCSPENQECRRRRQQRRKRYESILGLALSQGAVGEEGDVEPQGGTSGSQQSLVQEEDMEKMWRQVERTSFRVERAMPLFTETAAEEEAALQGLMESYRQGVEDLRSRLEESDCRRLELEAHLRTGGYANQETCSTTNGTLSPGTEGDALESWDTVALNGHAQNLTDMYWETRGLLQQQNAVRHRMQEQLATSLSTLEHQQPPKVQAPSIWLYDTNGNQQQLGYFHPDLPSTGNTTAPSLVLDDEEPPLHSDGERAASNIQTLMESAANKRVSSSDTHINNTGEDYEQMPLNIFESDQDERITPESVVFKRMSQEVELLRGQNKALHQHNQEMLNQLTEADREIARLKEDLGHLPEAELTNQARVTVLEMELNSKIRELLEARMLCASLERRLNEAESQASQLGTTDVPGDTDESGVEVDDTTAGRGGKGYLRRCFEATEAKLMDLEWKLHQSEQSCSELWRHNVEVEEAATACGQRAAEAEAEVLRLSAELEEAKWREGQKIPSEENGLQVSEGVASKAPGKLMKIIRRSEVRLVESEREEWESTWVNHLKWEGDEFWGTILNRIKADSSKAAEDKLICVFLIEVAEHMLVERQLLLLDQNLLLETASCTSMRRANLFELDEDTCSSGTGNMAQAMPENKTWSEFTGNMDLDNQRFCEAECVGNDFPENRQLQLYLLNYITSVDRSSPGDQLKLRGHWLCKHYGSNHLLHTVHTTVADAHHWKLNEAQRHGQLTSSPACTDCTRLGKENGELRATVSLLVKELEKASAASKPVSTNPLGQDQALIIWLQDIKAHLAMLGDCDPEVPSTSSTLPPISDHRVQLLPSESQRTPSYLGADEMTSQPSQGDQEKTGAGTDSLAVTLAEQELSIPDGTQPMDRPEETSYSLQESRESQDQEVNIEMSNHGGDVGLAEEEEEEEDGAGEEKVVSLRNRVKVLEEQLCRVLEELKAEHDGMISSLQLQHEKDMERLKEACERGLAVMEESQQRLLEGIHLRHQGELECLLTDRDQLLEEETAAALTAIQSIKRAYQLQLETHVEETQQSNISSDTHLQEIQQHHREELEVLVQQVSLQRQETGLLGQALQVERTALSGCQLENRALLARNQELSSLLAAEGKLCSSSQQGPAGEVFQLEISLRVAESELQWLRQEVSGLREDMLHAHMEHSHAVQQQTEFSTELSELKVRFQTDVDVLRENLRLAHRALEQTIR